MSSVKPKILVVDDDPDIVLVLTDRLQALGYTTVVAGDGQRALEVMDSEEPGLVLLDLEMPHLSGMEVLDRLAQRAQARKGDSSGHLNGSTWRGKHLYPSIIVMTAHATIPRAVEAMKCGAYDFLTKPLDVDHLTIVIQKSP